MMTARLRVESPVACVGTKRQSAKRLHVKLGRCYRVYSRTDIQVQLLRISRFLASAVHPQRQEPTTVLTL